jgi:hypothetical protein
MTAATLDAPATTAILEPGASAAPTRFDWETFVAIVGPERARTIRLAAFQVAGQLARGRWPIVVRPSAIIVALAAGADVALIRAVVREAARSRQDPGVALATVARSLARAGATASPGAGASTGAPRPLSGA